MFLFQYPALNVTIEETIKSEEWNLQDLGRNSSSVQVCRDTSCQTRFHQDPTMVLRVYVRLSFPKFTKEMEAPCFAYPGVIVASR